MNLYHRYWIPSFVIALIALTVVYPWTLFVVVLAVLVALTRERIKYRAASWYLSRNHPARRAQEFRQFKVEQSVRRVEEARESTARLSARSRVKGAIPPAPRTARPCPCRECTSRRAKQQQELSHVAERAVHEVATYLNQPDELAKRLSVLEQRAKRLNSRDYKIRPLSVDELARMSPSQRDFLRRVKAESALAPQKSCTEGGPCRVGHRRIVHSLEGVRVASLCTRCGQHEYWLPYVNGK